MADQMSGTSKEGDALLDVLIGLKVRRRRQEGQQCRDNRRDEAHRLIDVDAHLVSEMF